jgi:hypothetical protein
MALFPVIGKFSKAPEADNDNKECQDFQQEQRVRIWGH